MEEVESRYVAIKAQIILIVATSHSESFMQNFFCTVKRMQTPHHNIVAHSLLTAL